MTTINPTEYFCIFCHIHFYFFRIFPCPQMIY